MQQIIHLIHYQVYLYIQNAHSKDLPWDGEDPLEVKNLENAGPLKLAFPVIIFMKLGKSTTIWSVLGFMAGQPYRIPSGQTELSLHLLATCVRIVDVERDDQNASRQAPVPGHVDPSVSGRLLDGNVAALHGTLLARVENHSENALDHDGAVKTVDALHWWCATWSEINHAASGSVLHGGVGLCFALVLLSVLWHQELRCPDLVLVSIFDVHVAIELNRMLICRVSGDGWFVDQLAVVVIIIVCGQEYRFPFCVASSSMTDDTGKNFHCMRSPDVAPAQTMYVKGCHNFWDAEQSRRWFLCSRGRVEDWTPVLMARAAR